MKKFIGTACALTALGFAVAIAYADDTTSKTTQNTMDSAAKNMDSAAKSADSAAKSVDSAAQSAGTVGTSPSDPSTTSESTTRTDTSKWKNTKTCTDAEGVTYYRGKKGYDNCVAMMKRSHKKDEQMSGSTGTESDNAMKQDSGVGSGSSSWSSGANDYSKPDGMSGDTQHKDQAQPSNPNP